MSGALGSHIRLAAYYIVMYVMNSLEPLSLLLIVATLACTCWRPARCSSAGMSPEELEEIEVFVRSVLAVAQPYGLGIPDRLPAHKDAPMAAIDGRLPDDLQRYLEGLLAVSSAVDRRTLVAMLLDDTFVIDEDVGPHRVFDRLHDGRKSEMQTETSAGAPKTQTSASAPKT